MIRSRALLREFDTIFESKTLYDLPENLARRKQLLPVAVQKASFLEIPASRINILKGITKSARPNFKRPIREWQSRQDIEEPSHVPAVSHHVVDATQLMRPRAQVSFGRPAVKLSISIPKKVQV